MKNALEDQKIDATSAGRFNFSGKKLSEYTVTNATAQSSSSSSSNPSATENNSSSSTVSTNTSTEAKFPPLQLMVYVSDDDIKNCKKMDKNIGLAMAGSARAVCDTAKAKKSKSSTSITNSSTAATTSVPTSSASSPDAAEKITGLAITGKDGLVSDIKDKFTKFLDAVITNLPDESILDDTQLKDVKSSLEHLVDFFMEGKSIGSLKGFNPTKTSLKDKLKELKTYVSTNENSIFSTTFAAKNSNINNSNSPAKITTICPLTVEFRAIQILSRINDVAQELEKVSKKLETDSNSSNSSSSQSSSSSLSSSSNSSNSKDAVNKMLDAIKDIADLGIGKQLEAVKELRNNEMFYEFPLDKFDDNLVDAMVGALPGTITAPQKENIKELAKFALQQARFADIGENEKTMCCGMRGRMKASAFAKKFANRNQKKDQSASSSSSSSSSPTTSQSIASYVGQTFAASIDADVNREVEDALGTNNIIAQLRKDGSFCSDDVDRPTQFACDGMLLPSRVAIINDPLGFLKFCVSPENVDAYTNAISINGDATPNTSNIAAINLPNFDSFAIDNAALQQAILKAPLPEGTCETQTYTKVEDLLVPVTPSNEINRSNNAGANGLKVYESKPNLASAMKDHHLRTLCSVSGTTTDIVAALYGMNKAKIKAALQSLKDAVTQNNNSDSNNNNSGNISQNTTSSSEVNKNQNTTTQKGIADQLTPEFKNLFLSIAMYMQAGQYHSAASVLCGLYCAALSLCEATVQTVVHIASYSALLEAFASSPAAFFPPVAA